MRTALMTADAAMSEEKPRMLLATIRAARAGDQDAFEDLMIASERRIALLAWRILGDADEVKEAIQETFIRLFRHLSRFDERRDFFGWLYTIAVNVCRDRARRRRVRHLFFLPLEKAPEAGSDRPIDEVMAAHSELELLTRAIDTLPGKERLAVILREIEELTTEEVAAILGSRPATVRVQIRNGREKIRRWMESHRAGRQR